MKKKFFLIMAFFLIGAVGLFAAETFENFNNAGDSAQNVAISGMQSWKWLVGFIPVGLGTFCAFKLNEYLNQKDENNNGQTEPKATRYLKVFAAGIIGTLISYMLLGLFGLVFAGKSFSETWEAFVTSFWSQLF